MPRLTPRAPSMLRPQRSWPLALAAAAVLVAAAGAAAAGNAPKKVTVKLEASTFKRKLLVDGNGRTLYMFTGDKHGKSRCYGACAKAWPPVLAKNGAQAVAGAKAKLLGKTRRKHGAMQLTYRNHPLYLFARDTTAGQLNGQRVFAFGGHWFAVSPAGTAIEQAAAAVEPVTISTHEVKGLGRVLVDGQGRTLYMFSHDQNDASRCYGACAKTWPPLLAEHGVRAIGKAETKLLGQTQRKDGAIQLTYRNHPLYLFAHDAEIGQANGQGVSHFGGKWHAVSPSGKADTKTPAAAMTSTSTVKPANAAVTISTRKVKGLGSVLVNGKGHTLYMFVPDKDKKVTCTSSCAAVWPPVLLPKNDKVSKSVAVTGKAKASLLGADPDPAGGRVVTYKGWPLYTYVADKKPGMTTGQALNLNGGLWYVLSPTGKVLHKKVRAGGSGNT